MLNKLKELTNLYTGVAVLLMILPGAMSLIEGGFFSDSPLAALYTSMPGMFAAFAVLFALSESWDSLRRRRRLWIALIIFVFGAGAIIGGVWLRAQYRWTDFTIQPGTQLHQRLNSKGPEKAPEVGTTHSQVWHDCDSGRKYTQIVLDSKQNISREILWHMNSCICAERERTKACTTENGIFPENIVGTSQVVPLEWLILLMVTLGTACAAAGLVLVSIHRQVPGATTEQSEAQS